MNNPHRFTRHRLFLNDHFLKDSFVAKLSLLVFLAVSSSYAAVSWAQSEADKNSQTLESAQLASIVDYVDDAQLIGQGRMRIMLWNLYDIKLYASAGNYQTQQPFALELSYLRKIKGKQIAKQGLVEMRKQGWDDEQQLTKWLDFMLATFPDVKKNSLLVGVYAGAGKTVFLEQQPLSKSDSGKADSGKRKPDKISLTPSRVIGQIEDESFAKAFFDIWLGEQTTAPKVRRKLLALENSH